MIIRVNIKQADGLTAPGDNGGLGGQLSWLSGQSAYLKGGI
jgi:hypothetical protein